MTRCSLALALCPRPPSRLIAPLLARKMSQSVQMWLQMSLLLTEAAMILSSMRTTTRTMTTRRRRSPSLHRPRLRNGCPQTNHSPRLDSLHRLLPRSSSPTMARTRLAPRAMPRRRRATTNPTPTMNGSRRYSEGAPPCSRRSSPAPSTAEESRSRAIRLSLRADLAQLPLAVAHVPRCPSRQTFRLPPLGSARRVLQADLVRHVAALSTPQTARLLVSKVRRQRTSRARQRGARLPLLRPQRLSQMPPTRRRLLRPSPNPQRRPRTARRIVPHPSPARSPSTP